jgi:diadenosine tetraphosphate (Ap4A) HIT family hydrolase
MGFTLDQRLADSSHLVSRVDDIQVRLADDSRYAWLILVPEHAGTVELHDLTDDQRNRLFGLASRLGNWMKTTFAADKINVASLGNLVPQLHLHVVARQSGDAAWPGPIWGHASPIPRTDPDRQDMMAAVAAYLENGES